MPDLNERDAKIVQYLQEAHAKERELEAALQTHIETTTRMPYKKRLRKHLTETRAHAKALEKRMKQLGAGDSLRAQGAEAVQAAVGLGKAVAKAPVELVRGESDQETMLKNAKDEFMQEHAEIAMYSGLEAFAEKVGDRETAQLARSILRDEERMAKFLEGQISTIAKAVATEEIPSKLRTPAGRRRTAARRGGRASSGRRRTAAAA